MPPKLQKGGRMVVLDHRLPTHDPRSSETPDDGPDDGMNKLIVTTPIGSFAIKHADSSFRILEQGSEQELLKKYNALLLTPETKNFRQLYGGVCNSLEPFLADIRKKNLLLTKQAIKQSVTPDNLIIQTTQSISELTKSINLLVKRLREWYGFTLPEFVDAKESPEALVNALATMERSALLKKINLKEDETMGAPLNENDLQPIKELAKQLNSFIELRKKHETYLEKTMAFYCLNVHAVAGTAIGAKLLAKAGSLQRLATLPASTVQLLGAEKAFFRHLRTGARQPKYGLIFEHDLIGKLDKKSRGKMARCLADKISIAAKVDYFNGKFVGEMLKKQVEKKWHELKQRK